MKRKSLVFLALQLIALILSCIICSFFVRNKLFDRIRDWSISNQLVGENNYHSTCVGNFAYIRFPIVPDFQNCQVLYLTEEMLQEKYLVVSVRMGIYCDDEPIEGDYYIRLTQNNIRWTKTRDSKEIWEGDWYTAVFQTDLLCEGAAYLDICSEKGDYANCLKIYMRRRDEEYRMKTDLNDYREIENGDVFGDFLMNGEVQTDLLAMVLYTSNDDSLFTKEDTQVRLLHDL